MASKVLLIFLFGLFLNNASGEELTIESLEFLTADCDDCGMSVFGAVMAEVCGDLDCCLTPWMQGSFKQGGSDVFSGEDIKECHMFVFESDPNAAQNIGITIERIDFENKSANFVAFRDHRFQPRCGRPDVERSNH